MDIAKFEKHTNALSSIRLVRESDQLKAKHDDSQRQVGRSTVTRPSATRSVKYNAAMRLANFARTPPTSMSALFDSERGHSMLSFSLQGADRRAPIILYLHGLGVGGWSWDPVISALPEFGALAPDFPGHGASSETPWRSISDTAARVTEIMDTLPAERPLHVAGHSLGAYVGLVLLASQPERFATATLSGFHISPPSQPLLLKIAYVANGLIFRVPPLLRRFASVFGDEAATKRFVEGAKVIRSKTIRRAGIQVVDFEEPAGLDALTLPILAMAGGAEPEAIRSAPGLLAQRLRDVDPLVIEGRDHLWPIKEPAFYAEKLKAHIVDTTRGLYAPA